MSTQWQWARCKCTRCHKKHWDLIPAAMAIPDNVTVAQVCDECAFHCDEQLLKAFGRYRSAIAPVPKPEEAP